MCGSESAPSHRRLQSALRRQYRHTFFESSLSRERAKSSPKGNCSLGLFLRRTQHEAAEMGVGHLQTEWLWTSLIVSGVLAGDWMVQVPESPIRAPAGSSVTVPCTYDFPEDSSQGTPRKVLSEMWCRNESFCITQTYIYHSRGIFIDPAYRGRVQYLGTTGSKNCSFRITDLRTTDSGVYVFRFITDHPVEKLPGQKGITLQVTDGSRVSVVGIVIGVIFILGAIAVIAVWVRRRRRSRSLRRDGTI
ncbi:sialoadhesin [Astyanax mexicanus]|uniref:sialoadhesin n=1 Tax=Astyanax mexicanus TaxID=7994 RepID=UPI000BBDD05D|nr:sialoadhesin [Astyanax mexicanus]